MGLITRNKYPDAAVPYKFWNNVVQKPHPVSVIFQRSCKSNLKLIEVIHWTDGSPVNILSPAVPLGHSIPCFTNNWPGDGNMATRSAAVEELVVNQKFTKYLGFEA